MLETQSVSKEVSRLKLTLLVSWKGKRFPKLAIALFSGFLGEKLNTLPSRALVDGEVTLEDTNKLKA